MRKRSGREPPPRQIARLTPPLKNQNRPAWCRHTAYDQPREAEVLEGFAKEEAAKILILMDAVRCPPSRVAAKMELFAKRFYDHHARLIYVQVAEWWFEDVARMRIGVEPLRRTHYLEGNMGEYILTNSTVYRRESKLYADIEVYEDGIPIWNAPRGFTSHFRHVPAILSVCEAMSALGMFTLEGLRVISEIWGQMFFTEAESLHDAEKLTKAVLERLIAEGLPSADASQDHVAALYRNWPLPMYDIDLTPIPVTLDDLKSEQDRLYWEEVGSAQVIFILTRMAFMQKDSLDLFCPACNILVEARVIATGSGGFRSDAANPLDEVDTEYHGEHYSVALCRRCNGPFLVRESLYGISGEFETITEEKLLFPIATVRDLDGVPEPKRGIGVQN